MMRQAGRGALALVLIAAVLDSTGRTQPPANPDKVYYRDRKDKDGATKSVEGELKFSPTGFQVIANNKVVTTLSPADIVRVVPGDLAGPERKDVDGVLALEQKREWEKARTGFDDLLKKNATAPEKTRKYLEFKLAAATARAADDTSDDSGTPWTDPKNPWHAKTKEAAKGVEQYLLANKTGWEVWPMARTATRLQMELGDHATAARTWAAVAASPELPADLKTEAALQEIEALIRSKQYPVAGARSEAISKAVTVGPAKDRLTIYQIAAKAGQDNPAGGAPLIEAEIAKTKDPGVRATGYLMKGELFMAADKPREAMWEFLWVEVVYNQDRDEAAKAMIRTSESFRLQNDEDRAKAYRERLRRFRATL